MASRRKPDWDRRSSTTSRSSMRWQRRWRLKVPCGARWRQPERTVARVPFAGSPERLALRFARARRHRSFVQNGGQPWVPCGARWRQPERICARVPYAGSLAGPALGFARARRHPSFVQNGVQPRQSLQAARLGSHVHAEPCWRGLLSAARSGLFCGSRRERWVRSCREWWGGVSAYGIIQLRSDRFVILS